jgi:hypothetical protein
MVYGILCEQNIRFSEKTLVWQIDFEQPLTAAIDLAPAWIPAEMARLSRASARMRLVTRSWTSNRLSTPNRWILSAIACAC